MEYILFIVGRGKPRRYASANNEDEGVGNWNHTCHRITAGGAWRCQPEGRALALVHYRQIWFIINNSLTIGAQRA